jgi:hypothetical protein
LIFSLLLLLLLWWLFGDWKDASLKASTRVFWRFIYFDFFVFVWLREMSGGDVKVFISFLMIYIMHSLSILHLEQVEWAGGRAYTDTRPCFSFHLLCEVMQCSCVCVQTCVGCYLGQDGPCSSSLLAISRVPPSWLVDCIFLLTQPFTHMIKKIKICFLWKKRIISESGVFERKEN